MKRWKNSLQGVAWVLCICFVILLTGCQKKEEAAGPDLYPATRLDETGTGWGYIDQKGTWKIEPEYAQAGDFLNGYAVVKVDDRYGVINEKGELVIEAKYEEILPFADGIAYARSDEQVMLNEAGEVLFSTNGWIGPMAGELAVFAAAAEDDLYRYGYVSRAGEVVIPPQYSSASPFSEGKAVVQIPDAAYAVIDTAGNVLHTLDYAVLSEIGEGWAAFREEEKWGYLDMATGEVMISPQYETAERFENGVAIVNNNSYPEARAGVIRKDGSVVIKPEYAQIERLGEGLLAVGKPLRPEEVTLGSIFALAKEDGTFLTDFQFYTIGAFDHGRASVTDRESTYFIDQQGRMIADLPKVLGLGSLKFDGRIVKALIDQEMSYLDRKGEVIWKAKDDLTLPDQTTVLKKKYRPNRNILTYYPELTGLKDSVVQDQINRQLRELFTRVTASAGEDLYYNYYGSYTLQYAGGDLAVLGLESYEYPFRAAHGMPVHETFHIDLGSGTFYQLADLFRPGSDYVSKLNAILAEQVKEKGEEMGLFSEEFTGIRADQPFIITADALQVYFSVYEIAPYAVGFPTFSIPYEEMMDLIDTEGPLWRAFHQ